ncbi:MAG: hypothetical protein H7287_13985 [Thermoleophilia bacterium]|nr:hypothetical protein [Thermoleophilia bacterium]
MSTPDPQPKTRRHDDTFPLSTVLGAPLSAEQRDEIVSGIVAETGFDETWVGEMRDAIDQPVRPQQP